MACSSEASHAASADADSGMVDSNTAAARTSRGKRENAAHAPELALTMLSSPTRRRSTRSASLLSFQCLWGILGLRRENGKPFRVQDVQSGTAGHRRFTL